MVNLKWMNVLCTNVKCFCLPCSSFWRQFQKFKRMFYGILRAETRLNVLTSPECEIISAKTVLFWMKLSFRSLSNLGHFLQFFLHILPPDKSKSSANYTRFVLTVQHHKAQFISQNVYYSIISFSKIYQVRDPCLHSDADIHHNKHLKS